MSDTHNIFAEAFASRPVLVDPGSVSAISASLSALDTPEGKTMLNAGFAQQADDDGFWEWGDTGEAHPYRPYVVQNGVLQIPVYGVLLNKFSYQFGRWATGYQYIERALERGLEDPEVRGVALVSDSGGGEVAGCFECAEKIYEARQEKPIAAFAADHAYSAAYALTSAADQYNVAPSGGTGSIGVVTMHVDISEMLTKAGMKVTFIFAGKHKVDGNSYEKLPDSVKGRIQQRIDKVYGVFTSTVARNRNLEESAVRDTEALTYDAEASVEIGLADRVGSFDETLAAFEEEVAATQEGEFDMATQPKNESATTFTQAEVDAKVSDAKAEGIAEGAKGERARAASIYGLEEAKTRPAATRMAINAGLSLEDAKAQLADMPEEATAAAPKKEEASDDKDKDKSKAQEPNGFDQHMDSSGNPNVGSDDQASGDELDDDAKATASIAGAARMHHGKKPKQASA